MSAYVVSKDHIDALITFWKYGEYNHKPSDEADMTGQLLWEQNVKSVNFRYRESNHIPAEETPAYQHEDKHTHDGRRLTPVDIIKLVQCWQYQSCEDHEQSTAWGVSCRILDMAIDKLDGYDNAPWGI